MRTEKCSLRTMGRLYVRGIRLLSRYIPYFFTAITAHTLVTAITPYVTVCLLARLLEELSGARDTQALWMWAGLTVGVQVGAALVGGLLKRFKEAKWESLYRSADRILTDKLLSMEHAVLDDQATRDCLARVRENASALGRGLVQIPDVFQSLLHGVCGTVSAVAVSWRLFTIETAGTVLSGPLGAAALLVVLIGTTFGVSRLQTAAQRAQNAHTADVVAVDRLYYTFYDTMFDPRKAADMRLYRQDTLTAQYLEEADRASFEENGLKRRSTYGGGALRAWSAGLSALWIAAVYAFTAYNTFRGVFGLGTAVQAVGALTLLFDDIGRLRWSVERMRLNAPYLETVYAFLDVPHRMYQGTLTTEKRADRDYEIEFRHVSFRYPHQTQDALHDVCVTLRVGSRLAIVGENGSGKSTFVKLLCRLYDPDEGEILLNGIDIRKYRYEEYIALIAAVFQDFQLLAQPLGDNVACSREYDVEHVTQCLEDAGFGERLYEWNGGLATPLMDGGAPLSADDAQSIAIARALYKDAPLIILDEPTAALDPVAEAAIYAGLDRIVGDRTAIFISHRLSSCRFCHEILVFDGGRIVQRGSHEDLVAQQDGKYHALWHAQAQYYTR